MRRLREYATEELGSRAEVREAILIGSLARGDWSAFSDADVVVVVDRAAERWIDRSPDYVPRKSVGVDVDVLVYTPEETAGWGPRFREDVEGGVVLYRR